MRNLRVGLVQAKWEGDVTDEESIEENIEKMIRKHEDFAAAVAEAVGGRVLTIRVYMPLLFAAGLLLQTFSRITRTQPLLDLRRMADMRHRYWMYDTSAVRNELGYTENHGLSAGARETVEWYRREGWID